MILLVSLLLWMSLVTIVFCAWIDINKNLTTTTSDMDENFKDNEKESDTEQIRSNYIGDIIRSNSIVGGLLNNSTVELKLSRFLANRLTNKIIGGKDTTYGDTPWQARVVYPNGQHTCGATVISEYWLLSAAHCFIDGIQYHVIVGDHDTNKNDYGEQKFEVEFFKHEMYNDHTCDFDIALLKIIPKNGSGIIFNYFVMPACLPKSTTTYEDDTKVMISGWGRNNPLINAFSTVLKSAVVKLINREKCEQLYTDYIHLVTKRMICAGDLAGGTDICHGDSGGPLVLQTRGCYTLIGIASWGNGCALRNNPNVFALVSEFLPWILTTRRIFTKGKDRPHCSKSNGKLLNV